MYLTFFMNVLLGSLIWPKQTVDHRFTWFRLPCPKVTYSLSNDGFPLLFYAPNDWQQSEQLALLTQTRKTHIHKKKISARNNIGTSANCFRMARSLGASSKLARISRVLFTVRSANAHVFTLNKPLRVLHGLVYPCCD